jgi:hypothetical protein
MPGIIPEAGTPDRNISSIVLDLILKKTEFQN